MPENNSFISDIYHFCFISPAQKTRPAAIHLFRRLFALALVYLFLAATLTLPALMESSIYPAARVCIRGKVLPRRNARATRPAKLNMQKRVCSAIKGANKLRYTCLWNPDGRKSSLLPLRFAAFVQKG